MMARAYRIETTLGDQTVAVEADELRDAVELYRRMGSGTAEPEPGAIHLAEAALDVEGRPDGDVLIFRGVGGRGDYRVPIAAGFPGKDACATVRDWIGRLIHLAATREREDCARAAESAYGATDAAARIRGVAHKSAVGL